MYCVSETAIRDIRANMGQRNMASGAITRSGAEAGWAAKGQH